MDRAVLDAYGWSDLRPTCEFLLDYEDEDDEEPDGRRSSRGRKKPWRYRWPDEFRDEVLARLLALNAQRAASRTSTTPPRSSGSVKQMACYCGGAHRNLDPTPLVGVGEADFLASRMAPVMI